MPAEWLKSDWEAWQTAHCHNSRGQWGFFRGSSGKAKAWLPWSFAAKVVLNLEVQSSRERLSHIIYLSKILIFSIFQITHKLPFFTSTYHPNSLLPEDSASHHWTYLEDPLPELWTSFYWMGKSLTCCFSLFLSLSARLYDTGFFIAYISNSRYERYFRMKCCLLTTIPWVTCQKNTFLGQTRDLRSHFWEVLAGCAWEFS